MRLGAATEPLDGRAFTVVVDARVGKGAGSSAATFHRITMRVTLCLLSFFGVLEDG
jgi:hypothetical protein